MANGSCDSTNLENPLSIWGFIVLEVYVCLTVHEHGIGLFI